LVASDTFRSEADWKFIRIEIFVDSVTVLIFCAELPTLSQVEAGIVWLLLKMVMSRDSVWQSTQKQLFSYFRFFSFCFYGFLVLCLILPLISRIESLSGHVIWNPALRHQRSEV
jgi:hypothetical protein